MKKIWLPILFSLTLAGEITAEAVVDSMLQVMSPENAKGLNRQVNISADGNERVLEYESYSTGKGRDNLLRYTQPSKIKGTAFLMKNHSDDIWAYFPRTRRTRKLASHAKKQKVQGSDFSYEDFAGGDTWRDDYHHALLEDQQDQEHYIVEFLPRDDYDSSYERMIVSIRKSDFYPTKIEYYGKRSILEKTLLLQDVQMVEGFPTAMTMLMIDHLDGTQSRMEILDITYDVKYPEDFFMERSLRK